MNCARVKTFSSSTDNNIISTSLLGAEKIIIEINDSIWDDIKPNQINLLRGSELFNMFTSHGNVQTTNLITSTLSIYFNSNSHFKGLLVYF